jgi:uncharacterized protein YdcH (DUF465 family)
MFERQDDELGAKDATIARLTAENAALDRNFRDAVDARTRALNEAVDQRAKQVALTAEVEALRQRAESAEQHAENQRQRIVYLEGATNHACGTPLTIALADLASSRARWGDDDA